MREAGPAPGDLRPQANGEPATPAFVTIDWHGRSAQLEYAWVGVRGAPEDVGSNATDPHSGAEESIAPLSSTAAADRENARSRAAPAPAPIVFLHEGLGSVSAWRDFPARLCHAYGLRGLVFSRRGYGRSTPRPANERWPSRFMHEQAELALPQLFAQLGIVRPWLFGHSDGASIALLHAATHDVAGVVAVAPHLFVEDLSIAGIEAARAAYETGDLRSRLARHHADVDSAFRGWNDVWLDPAFRRWNIEAELASVRCPVLAVQGRGDEYGTLAQIDALVRVVPQTKTLVLDDCGHSPHRDQPEALSSEAGRFMRGNA